MVDAAADQDWWSAAPIADTPVPATAPRLLVTPNTPGSSAGAPSDDDWWKAAPVASFSNRFSGEGTSVPQNPAPLASGLRTAADKKIASDDPGGAAKTFIEQFANTAMLNIPRNIDAYAKSRDSGRPFAEEYEKLKDADEAGSRLNRKASIGGTAAGIGAGMVTLPGIGGGATMGARALRAVATGAGYAGIAEAFDSKDPVHTALAMGLGGALGGVAAPVAEKIVGLVAGLVRKGKTAETFLNPDGTLTDEAVKAAQAAGIDPATFGTVMRRKFAETFAEKGANPASAREAAAGEFGVPLSRGQSTGDLDAIRFENMSSRGAYGKPAQDVANQFQEAQTGAIRDAGTGIGERLAGDRVVVQTPHTAGQTINSEVGANAARARDLVARSEEAATREAAAARGTLDDQGNALTDVVSGGRPPLSRPEDAGEVVGEALRRRAAGDRAGYKAAYDDALSREGEFSDLAFRDVGERIRREGLKAPQPVIIDENTPNASKAIDYIDRNLANLRITDKAQPRSMEARTAGEVRFPGEPPRVGGETQGPGDVVGVNMQGVEQARKVLVEFYKRARASGDPSDVRAMDRVIKGFDDELETAIATGLFKGDEGALPALKEARALFSQYQRTFRPQGQGDDVGAAMRRIIERNATPEEIANMLYGSARTGQTGLSVRLAQRLEDTLGRDSDAWSAVRQAAWMRVSQPRNQAGEVDPAKAATNILDFTNSTLGRRLFGAEELGAMRAHAVGIRQLEESIAQHPATLRAESARNAYQEIFGGEGIGGAQQQVFRRIINGEATPEETVGAVFNAISGNPGNASRVIQAIERITGRDSDSMAAVRQGVWQRLTQNAEGKDQPGAQKTSQALNEFLNGKGRSVAERLFDAEQLGEMRRYANVLKMTVVPPNARTNSDTAPALLAALNKYGTVVSSMLGAGIDGGLTGGLAGYAVSTLLKKGVGAAKEGRAGARAATSFNEGAPVTTDIAIRAGKTRGPAAGLAAPDIEEQLSGRRDQKPNDRLH